MLSESVVGWGQVWKQPHAAESPVLGLGQVFNTVPLGTFSRNKTCHMSKDFLVTILGPKEDMVIK